MLHLDSAAYRASDTPIVQEASEDNCANADAKDDDPRQAVIPNVTSLDSFTHPPSLTPVLSNPSYPLLDSSAAALSAPAGASCAPEAGSSSSSPPTTTTLDKQGAQAGALSQIEQVEQYKDDIALHTHLQLQGYLEDLTEQDSAAVAASFAAHADDLEYHQVEAMLAASLYPATNHINNSNALDPLYNPSWSAHSYADSLATNLFQSTASPTAIPAEEQASMSITPESFQQQMVSLEAAAALQSFSLAMDTTRDNLALGGGGVGVGLHALQDEEDEEDDDEECLPPSETKYILYDDHVSPISIADALAMLNDTLEEDLAQGVLLPVLAATAVTAASTTTTTTTTTDESQHVHPQTLELGRNSPIFSDNSNAAEQRALASGKGEHTNEGGIASLGDSDELQTRHVHGMQGSVHNGFFEQVCSEEDRTLGRPSHRGGPDISLNLAGNILSPISIHDLFFSRYYTRLVYLNLWDTNLGIWGAQAVGGLMADRSCRIQYLNLGCNRLGFEGIVQLFGLYKNDSLVELDLSENHLGHTAVHSLQQIMVRREKDKACNIRRLNLSNNEINDVGCISIAKLIMGTMVTHLDLSFNKISDWGASTILASFESNEVALKDINMEANPLSFAGGVDICKILVLPQSRITTLDLRGAKVTDVGVPYLAEALKSHQCPIVSLNLYDCQLTDTGILKLAIKLCVNKSLRVLGLGCNCIGDTGILALSQGLCLNSHLEELDLSENDVAISRAGLDSLLYAMRANTSLLDLRLDVDGHPNVLARGMQENDGTYMGGYAHHSQHQDQQPVQHQPYYHHVHYQHHEYPQDLQQPSHSHQHQLEQAQTLPTHAQTLATPVGEVLAPTHAALAQPLQVPPLAPLQGLQGAVLVEGGMMGGVTAASITTAPPVLNEQDLERDRQQLMMALSSVKSLVRQNFKRTTKLRKLCFEILAVCRLLMFAKDAPLHAQEIASRNVGHCGVDDEAAINTQEEPRLDFHHLDSTQPFRPMTVPILTGLPTPPIMIQDLGMAALSLDAESSNRSDNAAGKDPLNTTVQEEEECPILIAHGQGPRGTLAGLPWEIKEMILRSLDRDGLLSEPQFQSIMSYGSSHWETVRQPWERWGEIRETILERTRCYYYQAESQ
ncbi:NACHT, LRR and PYD domains-containing protein 13 [Mortierella alpina]|uniref:NACHT, LRR and PYD domains-containing protein 13 n=1 Tax=Mortierella alpina TaxID=64518 RepID=A0A9P6LY39_MORAP|nr:NACHT, LRR and PYD domains-containing protein 13 [Mortierella alpina]